MVIFYGYNIAAIGKIIFAHWPAICFVFLKQNLLINLKYQY